MWKLAIIIVLIAVTCTSAHSEIVQNTPRKKHLYHYGLIHYWAFLALKAKIIFLIGTFISLWVLAGKAFAFLYYAKNNNKDSCKCPDIHSEKFVVSDPPHFETPHFETPHFESPHFESPHFEHKYSTIFNSLPPGDYFPQGGQKPYFSPYKQYSRSIENSVVANMDILKSVIKKVDLTELAFDAMNLKRKSCKKRFICEAEQQAKNNSLFALSLYMFSDVGLIKYRSNSTINSIEDCQPLGRHCNFIRK